MIISSDILKNDFEEVIGFFLSWILVGFLTLLFLIFSYLRKTEYNKKHLCHPPDHPPGGGGPHRRTAGGERRQSSCHAENHRRGRRDPPAARLISEIKRKRPLSVVTGDAFYAVTSGQPLISERVRRSASVMGRSTLQGLPAATTPAGISRVTTLPAPMTLPSPMDTPPQTVTFAPSQTFSPSVMGWAPSPAGSPEAIMKEQ